MISFDLRPVNAAEQVQSGAINNYANCFRPKLLKAKDEQSEDQPDACREY